MDFPTHVHTQTLINSLTDDKGSKAHTKAAAIFFQKLEVV